MNANSETLIVVCLERNLCVSNTIFDHMDIHKYTWKSGSKRSMIDFVIVDSMVFDTRAPKVINVGTDHDQWS